MALVSGPVCPACHSPSDGSTGPPGLSFCGSWLPQNHTPAVSADKASVVPAGKTSVVPAGKTSAVSADKTSAVSQDIPTPLPTRPRCGRLRNVVEMSWETADVLPADTTDVLAAGTTDVLPADPTHVLPVDNPGFPWKDQKSCNPSLWIWERKNGICP